MPTREELSALIGALRIGRPNLGRHDFTLFPQLREDYAARGVTVLQCYATADLGLIAYESEARGGMILDEAVILEIMRPGTDDPVPEGEVGEVVFTSLTPEYPLIRFATGDLSAVLPGASPCGRTNQRIKGWMGRADQTTKVKGMFVQPRQIAVVAKRHPELLRARLTVTPGRDSKGTPSFAKKTPPKRVRRPGGLRRAGRPYGARNGLAGARAPFLAVPREPEDRRQNLEYRISDCRLEGAVSKRWD